jgi:alpha-L-rhamnosidase
MVDPRATPHDLRVEGRVAPLGLTEREPLLSWRLDGPQAAWRVTVRDESGDAPLFDSGRRDGPARRLMLPDAGWRSRQRLRWTVESWPGGGAETDAGRDVPADPEAPAASATATWETGLLDRDEWVARWIGYVDPDVVVGEPEIALDPAVPPLLRRRFELDAPVAAARLRVTALGLFELHLNGTRVGAQRLAPGWTDYERRVEVWTFDVTELLRPGANVLAATLADGWFAGCVGFFGRGQYGDGPALLAQLELERADGGRTIVATDRGWRAATGELRAADLQLGEQVDLRQARPGWREADFDDGCWADAQERAWPAAALVGRVAPDVEAVVELDPVAVETDAAGVTIVDLGQNVAGHLAVDWDGRAGETLTLRHGEMLDADGALWTENLRSATQRDEVTCAADGPAAYEPRFTFHGFRYAELTGVPRERLRHVRGRAVSAALPQTGEFACSDPLLEQLQSNVVWSQRDNFVDVPTDCPQRSERLGWSGDVQIFAPTAAFNMDVEAFLTRWVEALLDGQRPTGAFPDVAPTRGLLSAGNAGWTDAAAIVPWVLHERYDNARLLARVYPALERHLAFLAADSSGGLRFAGRYGEWVPLEAPTPSQLVGTAYLARSAQLTARIAATLGRADDAARHEALAARTAAVFRAAFAGEDGRVGGERETQTGYVLALAFGLLPRADRAAAARRLAERIEATGHLATGFLGTPLALPTLSRHGRHELACRLAQKDTFPSWGFTIRQGATTIWERWDGWTEERGFHPSGMNSFNHYSLGSVGEWMYGWLGGLRPRADGPGHRRWTAAPLPGGTVEWARTRYRSGYGEHVVEWAREGDELRVEVAVPHGTEAELRLPGGAPEWVGPGRHARAGRLG